MKMDTETRASFDDLTTELEGAEMAVADAIMLVWQGRAGIDWVNETIAALNRVVAAAAFRAAWLGRVRAGVDRHTERWREGETGKAHLDMIAAWTRLDLEPVDAFPPGTAPRDLRLPRAYAEEWPFAPTDTRDLIGADDQLDLFWGTPGGH